MPQVKVRDLRADFSFPTVSANFIVCSFKKTLAFVL